MTVMLDTEETMVAMSPTDLTLASIEELTEMAVAESNATSTLIVGAVAHYVRLGEILIEVRDRLGSDAYHRWVEKHLNHGNSWASQAMRLATYRDQLPPELFEVWTNAEGKTFNPSINRCILYMRGLPDINPRGGKHYKEPVVAEVKRLRSNGLSYADIGGALGIGETTAYNICNPDAYRRMVKRQAQRRTELRRQNDAAAKAYKEQQERQERDRLARVSGGELAEAYSLIRRALAALDKAGAAPTALRHLHQAEDAVVSALRADRADGSAA